MFVYADAGGLTMTKKKIPLEGIYDKFIPGFPLGRGPAPKREFMAASFNFEKFLFLVR